MLVKRLNSIISIFEPIAISARLFFVLRQLLLGVGGLLKHFFRDIK